MISSPNFFSKNIEFFLTGSFMYIFSRGIMNNKQHNMMGSVSRKLLLSTPKRLEATFVKTIMKRTIIRISTMMK